MTKSFRHPNTRVRPHVIRTMKQSANKNTGLAHLPINDNNKFWLCKDRCSDVSRQ